MGWRGQQAAWGHVGHLDCPCPSPCAPHLWAHPLFLRELLGPPGTHRVSLPSAGQHALCHDPSLPPEPPASACHPRLPAGFTHSAHPLQAR